MSINAVELTLDLNPTYRKKKAVWCSQLDNVLRTLQITITDGGTPYDVEASGYAVYIEGTKPDYKGFSYEVTDIGGTVAGAVITIPVQTQMTAVKGAVETEIVLKSGSDRIGSANFLLVVERAGLDEDTDVSETDIPGYIDGAQRAAEAAAQSADDAEDAKDLAVSAAETAQGVLESIPEDYSDLSNDVDDLKNAKNASLINEETAFANPLTFSDGADDVPVKDCVIDIQPSQPNDYDSVWVGGAGKNKFDIGTSASDYEENTAGVINSISGNVITFNIKDSGGTVAYRKSNITDTGTFTYSATASKIYSRLFVRLRKADDSGWMTSSDASIDGMIYNSYFGGWYKDSNLLSVVATFTIPSCLYWQFGVGYANNVATAGTTETISNIQVETGSTATTWTPYSNICPISGWTEANIHRCGVNQWDEEWEVGGLAGGTGLPYAVSDRIRSKNYCRCTPNTTYWQCNTVSNVYLYVWWYDENKTFISSGGGIYAGQGQTVTSPANAHYFKFSTYGNNFTNYTSGFGLNLPSTDTTYHAYEGTTYSVDLSTAGTVYGGTLNVTTGVLTVDKGYVGLGSLTWSYTDGVFGSTDITNMKVPATSADRRTGIISDMFPVSTTVTINADMDDKSMLRAYGKIYIRDTDYTDINAFKTFVTGHQLVYELATPQTYQLTPTEVTTLLKNNTLTANCGTVSLSYYADTKAYIDNAIATAVASL